MSPISPAFQTVNLLVSPKDDTVEFTMFIITDGIQVRSIYTKDDHI